MSRNEIKVEPVAFPMGLPPKVEPIREVERKPIKPRVFTGLTYNQSGEQQHLIDKGILIDRKG